MIAFENDLVTKHLTDFGAHTRNELAFLLGFIEPGDLILDIGAHIGTFTLPLAAMTGPEGCVIAVEQDVETFAVLKQNVSRQDLRCVKLACEAIGSPECSFVRIAVDGNTGANHLLRTASFDGPRPVSLEYIRGMALEIDRVALIKIDVEGMENEVLLSGTLTITRDRPIIYVEVSEDHLTRRGSSVEDLELFFRKHNYRFFRNVGERNSANDDFRVIELGRIKNGGTFFDLLALPAESKHLHRVPAFYILGSHA